MVRQLIVAGALAALCSACGPSPTEHTRATVKLIVFQAEYARTDTIKATLRNTSGADVTYSNCPLVVERRDGGRWERSDNDPPPACPLEAASLFVRDGDERMVVTQPIVASMPDGEYRLRVIVRAGEESSVPIASNTFRIVTR